MTTGNESEPKVLTEVQSEQIKLSAEFWNNIGLVIIGSAALPLAIQLSQGGPTWSAGVALLIGILGGYRFHCAAWNRLELLDPKQHRKP